MNTEEKGGGESDAARQIYVYSLTCDCGLVVNGDHEVEILSKARNHIDEAHPEFASRTDQEILSSVAREPAA